MDGVYFDIEKNDFYFIEFKNAVIKSEKTNIIESNVDSYVINRFLSTFCQDIDFKNINMHSVLVAAADKNANIFGSICTAESGKTTYASPVLNSIICNLVGYNYFNETMFFDDFSLYSGSQFDKWASLMFE